MERLNKIYEKYTGKDFHEIDGFKAYSFKESDISRKKPQPHLSPKVYYGGGASCQYEVIIKAKPIDSALENQFNELVTKWKDETGLFSTTYDKVINDTFLEIISLGKDIVPLILRDLKYEGGHWHTALKVFAGGENPVPNEYLRNSKKVREIWLAWGKGKKLI